MPRNVIDKVLVLLSHCPFIFNGGKEAFWRRSNTGPVDATRLGSLMAMMSVTFSEHPRFLRVTLMVATWRGWSRLVRGEYVIPTPSQIVQLKSPVK